MPESTTAETLGEISRNQKALGVGQDATRADIKDLSDKVTALPDWADVARVEKGLEVKINAVSDSMAVKYAIHDLSIAKLEGWGNWATKLGGGAIIAAVLVTAGLGR